MGERGDVIGRQKVEKMEKMELNLDCVPADHRVIGIEISAQCLKESLVPPAVTKTQRATVLKLCVGQFSVLFLSPSISA